MLLKNEIPILEFDTDEAAVFMPTHEGFDLRLPQRAVFAFWVSMSINMRKSTTQGLSVIFYRQLRCILCML